MFQELPKFMFYHLQKFLDDKIKVIMGTPIDPVFLKLLSRRYIIQSLQFILDCDQSWQTYFARNEFGPHKDNFRTDIFSHAMSKKIDSVTITFNDGKTEPKHIHFAIL